MKKKVIRLNENDIESLIKKIIMEEKNHYVNPKIKIKLYENLDRLKTCLDKEDMTRFTSIINMLCEFSNKNYGKKEK